MLSKQIDFFLVGAPKCGTTALYDALSQHPEIYLPVEKELHFFAPDFYPDDYITWEQYDAQFNKFSHELVMGESSVWYLYSSEAPKLIYRYNQRARILVALRNPVDMIRSLHSQYLFDNVEPYTNLSEALSHEQERKRGELIPDTVYNPRILFYSDIVDYYGYVKTYIEMFGRESVKVIVYDDFVRDPMVVTRELYEFLNVDDGFVPVIRKVNVRKKYRSDILRTLANPPFTIKQFCRKLIPFQLRRSIIKTINSLNAVDCDCGCESKVPEVNILSEQHRKNIIRLGELIDKDLSVWLK